MNLALQVGLSRVVGSRKHMHSLTVLEHAAEYPPKCKKNLLTGVLRTWLAFLPGISYKLQFHK